MPAGVDIPPDREQIAAELSGWLTELTGVEHGITIQSATLDSERAKLQAKEEEELEPLKQRRSELREQITSAATAHRSLLLKGKATKEIVLPGGKIYWRKVREGMKFLADDKDILTFLAKNRLSGQIVRIKREIMRSKIIRHPGIGDRLEAAGLISRGDGRERLFIEPTKVQLDTPDTGKPK